MASFHDLLGQLHHAHVAWRKLEKRLKSEETDMAELRSQVEVLQRQLGPQDRLDAGLKWLKSS